MTRIILLSTATLIAVSTLAQVPKTDGPDPLKLNGNVKEVTAKYSNNSDAHMFLQIDRDKKEMMLTAYDKDGKVVVNKNMKMNEHGQITRIEQHLASVGRSSLSMYEFENGRKSAKKIISGADIWTHKIYKYYSNGRIQQVMSYSKDGIVNGIETYAYSGGQTTVTETDGDGNLLSTIVYTFDDHNNMTHKKVQSHAWNQEWSMKFSYEYDEYGNYTKYTAYKNGKLLDTHERQITYM